MRGPKLFIEVGGDIFEKFYVDKTVFDPQYDYDFRNIDDGNKNFGRDNKPYYRPIGCDRKALKFAGLLSYGNILLGSSDIPDVWVNAYHGTDAKNMAVIALGGLKVGEKDVEIKNGYAYGIWIYSTQFPEEALPYSQIVNVAEKDYRVLF